MLQHQVIHVTIRSLVDFALYFASVQKVSLTFGKNSDHSVRTWKKMKKSVFDWKIQVFNDCYHKVSDFQWNVFSQKQILLKIRIRKPVFDSLYLLKTLASAVLVLSFEKKFLLEKNSIAIFTIKETIFVWNNVQTLRFWIQKNWKVTGFESIFPQRVERCIRTILKETWSVTFIQTTTFSNVQLPNIFVFGLSAHHTIIVFKMSFCWIYHISPR